MAAAESRMLLPDHKPDSADGLHQLLVESLIDFAAQPGDVNIDHVVERRMATHLSPDIASQHFARDNVP